MIKSTSLKVMVALGLLTAAQIASPALAGPACDPKIMEALNAKGWNEAQREVLANETFIYKPDSVFALSCFSSALGNTPSTFSSGSPSNPASNSLSSYMSNFGHGILGNSGSQGGTSSCTKMMAVWGQARCQHLQYASHGTGSGNNIMSRFSFANLSSDPRLGFPAPTNATYRTACSSYPSNFASNTTLINTVGVGATFDNANLFLAITDPLAALAAGTNCSPGILTGVEIGTSGTTYQEKVCPNPGCVPKFVSPNMKCCDQTNLANRCEP